jgi:hypothetical protein
MFHNRLRREFLSDPRHDFATPIVGAAQRLQNGPTLKTPYEKWIFHHA